MIIGMTKTGRACSSPICFNAFFINFLPLMLIQVLIHDAQQITAAASASSSAVVKCIGNSVLTIWSPQFGANRVYANNIDRTWIFIADPSKCVQIKFKNFDLEKSNGCSKDYVRILDGASTSAPPLVSRMCGDATTGLHQQQPTISGDGSVKSTRNALTLHLKTDDGGQAGKGFQAVITPVPCGISGRRVGLGARQRSASPAVAIPRCLGEAARSSHVTINFPQKGPYRPNVNLRWTFVSAPRTCLKVALKKFDVERSVGCTKDYIGVYDGLDEDISLVPMLMQMCGRSPAYAAATGSLPSIVSSKNIVSLTFKSDAEVEHSGFHAVITVVKQCPVIVTPSGPKQRTLVPPNEMLIAPRCGLPFYKPLDEDEQTPETEFNLKPRIVGGNISRPNSWPWQVSIRYGNGHVCGGSLISRRHVLSAAHCFKVLSDNPMYFEVWIGKHLKDDREPGNEQLLKVEAITMHRSYQVNGSFDSDLAILRLAPPGAAFTNFTQPICLPSLAHLSPLPRIHEKCFVTGFGETKGTGGEKMLKQAKVPIISNEQCSSWSAKIKHQLTKNMLCAGYEEGKQDSCQGDSGGPLVCKRNDVWYLGGVVSFGIDCAKAQSPGVYVRVENFVDWIEDNAFDVLLP